SYRRCDAESRRKRCRGGPVRPGCSVTLDATTTMETMEQCMMRDRTARGMIAAIEQNQSAFLLALGRAGGGEECRDDALWWTIGGSPIDYHNCVVRAELTDATADAAIESSIAALDAHRVPGTWHVG